MTLKQGERWTVADKRGPLGDTAPVRVYRVHNDTLVAKVRRVSDARAIAALPEWAEALARLVRVVDEEFDSDAKAADAYCAIGVFVGQHVEEYRALLARIDGTEGR